MSLSRLVKGLLKVTADDLLDDQPFQLRSSAFVNQALPEIYCRPQQHLSFKQIRASNRTDPFDLDLLRYVAEPVIEIGVLVQHAT